MAVDDDVIARFRKGDREAFLSVYHTYASTLRPLVARFFSRPFEREEAVQEVWLLVLRMSASYDPSRGELLPWLRTLAANRCKELLRALGRRPASDEQLSDDTLVEPSNPEQAAAAQRLRGAVARFEATLSAEETRVFRLSIIEERPHDEVATLLGLSVRRCKYLRMKLLTRAALQPALRAALAEVLEA